MADLAGQHRAFAIGKAQCGTESGAGAQYQCRERLRRIGVAVQGHQGIGLQLELISTSPSSRPAMATTAVFTGWPRPEVKAARIAARRGSSAQA
ncbi:hypothetical protein G6F50_015184 [Rhizopus delemar]|uniref:Uncharacterized protein n=1 Tax=Rhizopus delemar TaxID=936053 RepID=A0A9P6Y0G7_9FUNG|nr:hypothetical protein G6F50_015184 [Rhizopus delemar]